MAEKIKIGTRGSKLALWQARHVKKLLRKSGLQAEIITIETKGDRILHKSIAKIGSKGVFTEELEEQLRDGTIHLAVHSAKDLPSDLPEDLSLIAFTEREKVHDVVVSYNHDFRLDIGQKWLVGTASTRRVATVKRHYDQVRTTSIRGNLQTRMRKLEEGQCDALILAYAGVVRMGFTEHIVEELSPEVFTPAAGQGSVAVQVANSFDPELREKVRMAINHIPTEQCILAERYFLRRLQGGCSVPVFCLAQIKDEQIHIDGGVISLTGKKEIRVKRSAPLSESENLALEVAEEVLNQGGDKILERIKKAKSSRKTHTSEEQQEQELDSEDEIDSEEE
ncbi:MAG: hydroxymethylbilane synthase [Bernardetiaceae bacterium]|nr:hydroxymethylbilane synthase [Bernardetiaceae bacterium]